MMVETMLESSQDFGMSTGALPQWKRELLQRRAARSRPAPPPAQPPPPPPPPVADEDEELRYGPGIVKRLKSRYLSLALRDAPRRRPSVLRRAASLEHLLDERPPPAPRPPAARPPRPASVAAPPAALPMPARREVVKRARSVDALSRLDARDDVPHPPSPSPPPPQPPPEPPAHAPPPLPAHDPPPPPHAPPLPPPVPAPRPHVARAARPPRRPAPLLRETERPPPDVVRAALRKFESAPTKRPAPAARVSAVLRGLEGSSRTSTPDPRDPPAPRSPTPPLDDTPAVDEPAEPAPAPAEARPVSRAALEGIARAGSSMRFAFEAPKRGSHLPPLAATNSVLLGRARRVGVIRPMPAPTLRSPEPSPVLDRKPTSPPSTPRLASPPLSEPEPAPQPRPERRDPPPAALVEPIPRSPPEVEATRPESPVDLASEPLEIQPRDEPKQREQTKQKEEPMENEEIKPKEDLKRRVDRPLTNGFVEAKQIGDEAPSRLGGADIERAWNGTSEKKLVGEKENKVVVEKEKKVEVKKTMEAKEAKSGVVPWAGGGGGVGGSPLNARRPRAPPPASTSIVFNFSDRKEVPDYIENDGIVLRGRRNRIKAGEPGVVVLRPEALANLSDEESECDGPPSPCDVRFVNDNVLINGRSSMPDRPNRDRIAKLKLQFDDSLTRTFEYPSETSLCEEPDEPHPAHATHASHASLTANTHIVSAALSRYTPSKTVADAFQLGVTRHDAHAHPDRPTENGTGDTTDSANGGEYCSAAEAEAEAGAEAGAEAAAAADARPCCGSAARSWSEARTHATDLLF